MQGMNLPPVAADTTRFLDRWFQGLFPRELAECRRIQKRPGEGFGQPGPSLWTRDPGEAAAYFAETAAEGWDGFLGTLGRKRRASALADVGGFGWLWADVDYGIEGHGRTPVYATRAEALDAILAFPVAPTLLVESGYGFHTWWHLYEEPTAADWTEAMARLCAALHADPSTLPPNQILRVPGTLNFKSGEGRPVGLLSCEVGEVELDPFLALPPAPPRSTAEARPSGGEPAGGGRLSGRSPSSAASGTPNGADRVQRAGRPFETAKDIPIRDVLAWLGVEVRHGRSACPVHGGANLTSLRVGGERNVASCFAGCGTEGAPKVFTTVDLVAAVRGIPARDAVNELAEQFGFEGLAPVIRLRPARSAQGVGEREGEGAPPPPVPPAPPKGGGGRGRWEPVEVQITTRERDVASQALQALVDSGRDVFSRGGKLVEVKEENEARGITRSAGAPHMEEVPNAQLRSILSEICLWKRQIDGHDGSPLWVDAHVPEWAVRDLETRRRWPGLRPIEGVVEAPALRPDGSVLETPGYDEQTGLVYLPNADYPPVPFAPTLEDAKAAAAEVLDVVQDFPFEDECHKSSWLSGVLSPLARHAYRGCTPLHVVEANMRGTGKSKLCDTISELAAGRPMAGMTQSANEEEERKRITSILMGNAPMILIDNIDRAFGSAALDMLLTREEWSDRELGINRTARLPNIGVWYATGNNMSLKGDLIRRVVHVRLATPEERPQERTNFKHKELLTWLRANRGRLVCACLTLLRAYHVAGRPLPEGFRPWGSFESWSMLIRGCLVWVGLPDPAEAQAQLEKNSDQEGALLADFVRGWAELDQDGDGLTVGEACERLEKSPLRFVDLRHTLQEMGICSPGKPPISSKLGTKLRAVRTRNFDGHCIDAIGKGHGNVIRWGVRKVVKDKAPPPASPSGGRKVVPIRGGGTV